jgi:dipeptidase E
MRRLLLSSASPGIGSLPLAAGREVAGLRFAFVPTAAGPEFETKDWVQADRRQLEALGCEVSTLDLARAAADEVDAALAAADGVHLVGGNAYLLLRHARRSGFAQRVVPLVESGALLYAGTSAGSLLAGPDLAPAASPDNRAAVPELESSRGLGLVEFGVLPHDQEPGVSARHDAIVAEHPDREFVRLTDDEAVVVLGGAWEVVPSPLPA